MIVENREITQGGGSRTPETVHPQNTGDCHGPALVRRPGVGPARPIILSHNGPRPGPAYQFLKRIGSGPAQPITFAKIHGPARPMISAARPMRHGPYTGRPVMFVGRSVDVTGRPMRCPVLKSARICADVSFLLLICFSFFFLVDSVG